MFASVPRIESSLRSLAQRPGSLAVLALAINAIVQPYLGLVHDARLYALLVSNRITGGAYGHDLFLAYGSQDSFSLFSFLVAPVAAAIGIPLTFFLGYLLVRGLFFVALTTFLLRLFGANALTALSVLILAIDPIAFGGHDVFHVNEAFLTPRLPAIALTLFGLTALLNRRWMLAAGCILVGCLLHPIMAIVGFPLLAGWFAMTALPCRGFALLIAVSVAGSVVFLGIPAIGYRVFGNIDPEWREQVRLVAMYQFPFVWREVDLWRTLYAVTLVAFAAWTVRDDQSEMSRFAALVLLVGLGGLLATTVSSEAGYRLLLQAQLSRSLWVVHLLAPACLVLIVARAFSAAEESPRWLALGWVVAGLALVAGTESWWLAMILLPFALVGVRGLEATPRSPNWGTTAAVIAVVFGQLVSGLIQTGVGAVIIASSKSREMIEYLSALWLCLGMPAILAIILVVLDRLATRLRAKPMRIALIAGVTAILWQSSVFAISQTTWYRENGTRDGNNPEYVGRILSDQETSRNPTVYWAGARPERVWLETRACPYFEFLQIAGLMFNRQTAGEGTRRALAVGPFELEHIRELREPESITGQDRRMLQSLYGQALEEAQVDAETVARLAQEPGLDYIVVRRDLGIPYLATNGQVYIHDCRQLRSLAAR